MIKCTERSGVYQAVKRLFDILASLAALAVLSPLFLVIAILFYQKTADRFFTNTPGWARVEKHFRCTSSAQCIRTGGSF